MAPAAYGLRADYQGTVDDFDGASSPIFLGGIIAVAGHDFDVRAELEQGGGTIVVDEHNAELIRALDEYPALKRLAAPGDDVDAIGRYDEWTVVALRAELRVRDLPTGGARVELVARLEDSDNGIEVRPVAETAPDPTTPPPAAAPTTET